MDNGDAFLWGTPGDPLPETDRIRASSKFRTEVARCSTRVESLTLPRQLGESKRERKGLLNPGGPLRSPLPAECCCRQSRAIVLRSLCLPNPTPGSPSPRSRLAWSFRSRRSRRDSENLQERRGIHKWPDKREECIPPRERRREYRGAACDTLARDLSHCQLTSRLWHVRKRTLAGSNFLAVFSPLRSSLQWAEQRMQRIQKRIRGRRSPSRGKSLDELRRRLDFPSAAAVGGSDERDKNGDAGEGAGWVARSNDGKRGKHVKARRGAIRLAIDCRLLRNASARRSAMRMNPRGKERSKERDCSTSLREREARGGFVRIELLWPAIGRQLAKELRDPVPSRWRFFPFLQFHFAKRHASD